MTAAFGESFYTLQFAALVKFGAVVGRDAVNHQQTDIMPVNGDGDLVA